MKRCTVHKKNNNTTMHTTTRAPTSYTSQCNTLNFVEWLPSYISFQPRTLQSAIPHPHTQELHTHYLLQHTTQVIHNHYHLHPTLQATQTQPTQPLHNLLEKFARNFTKHSHMHLPFKECALNILPNLPTLNRTSPNTSTTTIIPLYTATHTK